MFIDPAIDMKPAPLRYSQGTPEAVLVDYDR